MKKVISFVLASALVLSCCSSFAFAIPVRLPDVEGTASTNLDAPQYLAYTKSYTLNMQNNTYADLTFHMADKGGKAYFEDLVSISFRTTNPKGSHWKIVEHNYTIAPDEFHLIVMLMDMEGDTLSNTTRFLNDFRLTPSNVVGHSLSANDGDGVALPPVSAGIFSTEDVEYLVNCQVICF